MAYLNLKAEMARKNLKNHDIAVVCGKSDVAVSKNINGIGNFSVEEAAKIRDKYFPECTIEYLFEKSEKSRR